MSLYDDIVSDAAELLLEQHGESSAVSIVRADGGAMVTLPVAVVGETAVTERIENNEGALESYPVKRWTRPLTYRTADVPWAPQLAMKVLIGEESWLVTQLDQVGPTLIRLLLERSEAIHRGRAGTR